MRSYRFWHAYWGAQMAMLTRFIRDLQELREDPRD